MIIIIIFLSIWKLFYVAFSRDLLYKLKDNEYFLFFFFRVNFYYLNTIEHDLKIQKGEENISEFKITFDISAQVNFAISWVLKAN